MKILETESHHRAAAAQIALVPRGRRIELAIRPAGDEGGRGGNRNVILTTLQAKKLAYALLLEADKVTATD